MPDDGKCKKCGTSIFLDGYHVCVRCAIKEIEKQKESTTMYDPMTADRPEAREKHAYQTSADKAAASWQRSRGTDGTVGFMEAMAAARAGKRVRIAIEPAGGAWLRWHDGHLRYGGIEQYVCESFLDCRWEIEKPPVKEYTFQEALSLMMQGAKMRPKSWGVARSVWIDEVGAMQTQWGQSSQLHTVSYLLEPWVEV